MTGAIRTGGVTCQVTELPLVVDEHVAAVERAGAGAVVVFTGVVRDHDHDRPVLSLEYVGHPLAEQALAGCRAEILADPQVAAVSVSHRTGQLRIGDTALVAAVSAAHRAEAFAACARLVDLVKLRVPIWKHQVFGDGTAEWVNCPEPTP